MLRELLRKHQAAIVQRWLEDALATYPADSAVAFGREQDPFANPVGHSLRLATRALFEALLDCDEMDARAIHEGLHEIIKIRAVQQFAASRAVGFVFQLKPAIRAELATAAGELRFASALAQLEGRIDQIALAAFDLFVQCREQVCELRVNEVKRTVAWVVDKMSTRDSAPASAGVERELERPRV